MVWVFFHGPTSPERATPGFDSTVSVAMSGGDAGIVKTPSGNFFVRVPVTDGETPSAAVRRRKHPGATFPEA